MSRSRKDKTRMTLTDEQITKLNEAIAKDQEICIFNIAGDPWDGFYCQDCKAKLCNHPETPKYTTSHDAINPVIEKIHGGETFHDYLMVLESIICKSDSCVIASTKQLHCATPLQKALAYAKCEGLEI